MTDTTTTDDRDMRCAVCGTALGPHDPVWRRQVSVGRNFLGRSSCRVAPCCDRHGSQTVHFYDGGAPCEGCGRVVHNLCRDHRARAFCCRRCEAKVRSAEARDRRREARPPRPCEVCGETFEPTRTDAHYCSPACRQRAYRARVTANDFVSDYNTDSRNG
jgi:hypothetical protein